MATPEELCAGCDEYVALLSKRDAEGIAALLACSIPEPDHRVRGMPHI